MDAELEAIKARLSAKKSKPKKPLFLSTGCTLLNLALTGQMDAGFACGTYNLLVGDSASGKTFLELQSLAEASVSTQLKEHTLIYEAHE